MSYKVKIVSQLAAESVITAMVNTVEQANGSLVAYLLTALEAGLAQGGEAGPVHSAALKVVSQHSWPLVDLRIGWADDALITTLAALWHAWEPQTQDSLIRELDPRQAPGNGVPGDDSLSTLSTKKIAIV